MVITIIILSILLLISIYGNFNILKKYNKLEKITNTLIIKNNTIKSLIEESSIRINELDDKGAFEGDDEVGFFFKYIKNIQNTLNDIEDGEKK